MKTTIISPQPTSAQMLLPKLRHLTLIGDDGQGNLEWEGTYGQWMQVSKEEDKYE